MKLQIATASAIAFLLGATTVAVRTAPSAIQTVPFPFPTAPADICQKATLESNGAEVADARFKPVMKGSYIVGCKLTFSAKNPDNLKAPFVAKFTNAQGTFQVSTSEIGSSDLKAPIPAGWNRVTNTQDYNPANPGL